MVLYVKEILLQHIVMRRELMILMVPRQHISNMEHGRRSISLKMARKLSLLLCAPIEKFIIEKII